MDIFCSTTIGRTLIETLNEMITLNLITKEIANQILEHYKENFFQIFNNEINKRSLPLITIEV